MSRGSNAVIEEDPRGAPAGIYCPECGCRGVVTNVSMLIRIQIVAISGPSAELSSSGDTPSGATPHQPGSPPRAGCQVSGRDHRDAETIHT